MKGLCLVLGTDVYLLKNFKWTEECQKSFEELKQYLSTPPLLTTPNERDILFMYLAVTDVAVRVVLVKEEGNIQKLIYYTSKILYRAETRYKKI